MALTDPPSRAAALAAGRARLRPALGSDSGTADVLTRYDRWSADLWDGLAEVYDAAAVLPAVVDVMAAVHLARSAPLRQRDRERILRPDWFQGVDAIGYVAYADLFAGDLQGIRSRIDYLHDLHVTYLHLMPLLTPRPGANDGGYAVMDYRSVRPDLGTMTDLAELAADLHGAGISLTLDLVLNHVAREHDWAERAKAGDARYRDYFYLYPDRSVPDAYEATLPEVFPAFAPGNFTWDETLESWVWTTFNEWQWDVNWSNPDVFVEFVDIVGFLANQGADCIRLDAIAFVWKRPGTNCQNQPEVHEITQAFGRARASWHRLSSSRPRPSSVRRTSSPTWARASTPARCPTSRTTTRSWSRSGRRSRPATADCWPPPSRASRRFP